jgi:hypothetical protein
LAWAFAGNTYQHVKENREAPLAVGERRMYLVEHLGHRPLSTPPFAGSQETVGAAYVFAFPFSIHVDASSPLEPQDSVVDGVRVRIYPPFLAREDEERRIDPSRVPSVEGTVPPDHNKVASKRLTASYGLGTRCDAVRLDFTPDPGVEFVSRIVDQYLGLCRWWSRQWWIGRDDRSVRAFLCNWFAVNERGERLAGFNAAIQLLGLYSGHSISSSYRIFEEI